MIEARHVINNESRHRQLECKFNVLFNGDDSALENCIPIYTSATVILDEDNRQVISCLSPKFDETTYFDPDGRYLDLYLSLTEYDGSY